eukprot:15434414-Alexandrium_andersonii.AAC.1
MVHFESGLRAAKPLTVHDARGRSARSHSSFRVDHIPRRFEQLRYPCRSCAKGTSSASGDPNLVDH